MPEKKSTSQAKKSTTKEKTVEPVDPRDARRAEIYKRRQALRKQQGIA